ncbi:MAG: xanthine dehydrogenase small subunit [Pseudorhodoplanes sp.]|nr:xanthine dehydrogenase small subunit [Pseudorhodoplanes sp.]
MPIRFRLNGVPRVLDGLSLTVTVLDYLRGTERLTGTKEGCAEGDCGACTIVVAKPGPDGPRYEAVNSCLMLVPQLAGCDVLTIEGLAARDGELHPIQSALVNADATQCGFCTPGFAMAMFAFSQDGSARDDETIHEALAGNLCRCTGYRPIVEACRKLQPAPAGCVEHMQENDTLPLNDEDAVHRCGEQIFYAPASLDALTALRAQNPDAILLGGGTDLGLRVSKEREAFPAVIWAGAVAELKRLQDGDGVLEIGGAVTYSEALPLLDKHFPSFAALVRRVGSRQIRNLGTFAGNLATASPIGDTIPCLFALNAEVTLRSQAGMRSLPVEQFIAGYRKTAMQPDEFIESIRIPVARGDRIFKAYKLSKRFDQDISTLVAAFSLAIENGIVRDIRAAFGGMAAQTARARHVEASLVGKAWTANAVADIDAIIAQDFRPMNDHRGGADYRLRAAANLVRRLQAETSSSQPVQVWLL